MSYLLLLHEKNVQTVIKNHREEFVQSLRDFEAVIARTGLPFTPDEQRRIAALTVFQSKGLFTEAVREWPTTTTTQQEVHTA